MPRTRPACVVMLLVAACAASAQRDRPSAKAVGVMRAPAATEDGIGVYFSPKGGALAAIVGLVGGAQRSLDVQAYLLTTKELAGPVARAHERGVKVRVLMDKENAGSEYSAADYFANAGVPVFLDAEHKEAHNKVMLIDGRTIVTGSFNFTRAADEENAENLLVITGKPKLYAAYQKNFEAHLKHARPAAPRGGGGRRR